MYKIMFTRSDDGVMLRGAMITHAHTHARACAHTLTHTHTRARAQLTILS